MPVTGLLAGARGFGMFAAGPASDFVLIASQTVGSGGASSITFSNIPQGYRHLQVRGIVRHVGSFTATESGLRFNGDSGSNYTAHQVYGDGSAAYSDIPNGSNPQTYAPIMWAAGNNLAANVFSTVVCDIVDYASTSKYKTLRSLNGWDNNGSGYALLRSCLWMSTSAVTSILLGLNGTNSNYAQYTSLSLYGIR